MITVTPIPILSDNYAYFLEADDGTSAIVDPGESSPIIDFLESRNVQPDTVFITHYHGDHVAGLDDILDRYNCRVIGKNHHIESELSFSGDPIKVLDTPGHKRDHVCFYFPESGFVLTGDCLFLMGCGKLLDGTAEEMFQSLQKLSALPDETRVYCGHEYTLANAEFCAHAAPDDARILERLRDIRDLRQNKKATIPGSIGEEKETNVFMKAKSAADFATLRSAKDRF